MVEIPLTFIEERRYLVNTIFSILGFKNEIILNDSVTSYVIKYKGIEDRMLRIDDSFFALKADQWFGLESLPQQPLETCETYKGILKGVLTSSRIPVIYGKCSDEQDCIYVDQNIFLNIDIFGSAFFMLTRYEELVKPDRDEHGRFPAAASLAYQEGFLDRPIINEYIEILWRCVNYLWPGLKRKERHFKLVPSHDIDLPFQYAFQNIRSNLRTCLGDIIKRRKPWLAKKHLKEWMAVKRGRTEVDPLNCFDLIMNISEQNNLKSFFYFMTGGENPLDGKYKFDHQYIKSLYQNIKERGHQIGLHPSYESYCNQDLIKKEYKQLRKICSELSIEQDSWGGRQHYLRLEVPHTWQYYDDADLNYDTSLSYADHAGFRCGICYEYPVFNLLTGQELKLTERPLIAMEGSLLEERYMNLNLNLAFDLYKKMIDQCKKFGGEFHMLFHNTSLADKEILDLYKDIIKHASV